MADALQKAGQLKADPKAAEKAAKAAEVAAKAKAKAEADAEADAKAKADADAAAKVKAEAEAKLDADIAAGEAKLKTLLQPDNPMLQVLPLISDKALKLQNIQLLIQMNEKLNEVDEPKRWAQFDAEAQAEASPLWKTMEELAKKHNVKLDTSGRRIVITFPKTGQRQWASFADGDTVKVAGNGGNRKGVKRGTGFQSHGKVIDEGGEEHNSLYAFTVARGIKYNGRATARVAVEDPQDVKTGVPLSFYYKLTEGDGKIKLQKLDRPKA